MNVSMQVWLQGRTITFFNLFQLYVLMVGIKVFRLGLYMSGVIAKSSKKRRETSKIAIFSKGI